MTASSKLAQACKTFGCDVAEGFFEITHNGFALLGLAVVFGAITLLARADLRNAGETELRGWLQARQTALLGAPPELDAVERATARNPKDLPKAQAAITYWLSRKYRVAPEPVSALVAEAFQIGSYTRLDPTLILSIVAVESGFNPFAQSSVGAQGLMQVMTRVHSDKYENFGGHFAAFDPVTNLRVGVKVLQECIGRAGSLEGGLRYYVGAANIEDDGGYVAKVLAEHARLRAVMAGKAVPIGPPIVAVPPASGVPAVSVPVMAAPAPAAVPQVPAPAEAALPADKVAALSERDTAGPQ